MYLLARVYLLASLFILNGMGCELSQIILTSKVNEHPPYKFEITSFGQGRFTFTKTNLVEPDSAMAHENNDAYFLSHKYGKKITRNFSVSQSEAEKIVKIIGKIKKTESKPNLKLDSTGIFLEVKTKEDPNPFFIGSYPSEPKILRLICLIFNPKADGLRAGMYPYFNEEFGISCN